MNTPSHEELRSFVTSLVEIIREEEGLRHVCFKRSDEEAVGLITGVIRAFLLTQEAEAGLVEEVEPMVPRREERAFEALKEVNGCFEEALVEGIESAMVDGNLEKIKDIWNRRITFAYQASQKWRDI